MMKQYFVLSLADKDQLLSVSKNNSQTMTQSMVYATQEYPEDRGRQDRGRNRILRTKDVRVVEEHKAVD